MHVNPNLELIPPPDAFQIFDFGLGISSLEFSSIHMTTVGETFFCQAGTHVQIL